MWRSHNYEISDFAISDYELAQTLPADFRGSLPTIEEIEKELQTENQRPLIKGS